MELDFHGWMLGFVRASGFLLVLPVFSAPNVPVVVRVSLAAMLGFLTSPAIAAAPAAGWFSGLGQLAMEAGVGVTLGFVARIAFGAFELAGHLISTELGLNLSAVVNPVTTSPTQAPGMIVFLLATTLLFALDLHHWLIEAFVKSYVVVPAGGMRAASGLLTSMVKLTSGMFVVAVQMAAPMMAVSFIVTLVFAVLGRAVPQMNVFSESFAFRIMAGLMVLGVSMPLLGQHIANLLRRVPEDMLRIAQWLGPP